MELGYGLRMTKAMDWLNANAPGFAHLSREERDAITDFSLLWSLFENRILATQGNADAICNATARWEADGQLDAALFKDELVYFKQRYFNPGFTHHFDGLRLNEGPHKLMVRSVLDGSDQNLRNCYSASLIIVLRYRNNLFHGVKWKYEFEGQLDNFSNANSLLMKALDRYGGLASG